MRAVCITCFYILKVWPPGCVSSSTARVRLMKMHQNQLIKRSPKGLRSQWQRRSAPRWRGNVPTKSEVGSPLQSHTGSFFWFSATMRGPGANTINVFRACLGAQLTICTQKWRNVLLFRTVSLRFVLSRVCVFLYSLGPRMIFKAPWSQYGRHLVWRGYNRHLLAMWNSIYLAAPLSHDADGESCIWLMLCRNLP